VRKAEYLTAICEPIVKKKIWEPRRLTNLWASMASYRDGFTLLKKTQSTLVMTIHNRPLSGRSVEWTLILPLLCKLIN
jgi:hypothetical protein